MINHGMQHIQIYYEQSLSFMHMYVFVLMPPEIRFKTRWWHRLKTRLLNIVQKRAICFFPFWTCFSISVSLLLYLSAFLLLSFLLFLGSLLLYLFASLLLHFVASLFLCSLLLRCAASLLLLFSVFPCFSAFPASLFSPFPCFFAYQLFSFS